MPFSARPDGDTAPGSAPPWPGSSTMTGEPADFARARVSVAVALQGVRTVQPSPAREMTGATMPAGVTTAVAVAGSGSVVVVGAGTVVGATVVGATVVVRAGSERSITA